MLCGGLAIDSPSLRRKSAAKPLYSPDLAPSNYLLFSEIEETLICYKFLLLQWREKNFRKLVLHKKHDFYQSGLQKLILYSDKFLNSFNDYVEKCIPVRIVTE